MVIMEEVTEAAAYAAQINVYNQGKISSFTAGGEKFEKITACWNNTVSSARQMPAYGVSLNNETTQAIESGLWLEFVYDGVFECAEMPFEKLLINVERQFQGFNLIRYTSACGYDGRCFYLDLLNKNLDEMYELLVNL